MLHIIAIRSSPANRLIHKLSVDPVYQLHFHGVFSMLWLLSMILVPLLPQFSIRHDLVGLSIMEVSLWANFATHFGAMSAAISAIISARNNATEQRISEHIDI